MQKNVISKHDMLLIDKTVVYKLLLIINKYGTASVSKKKLFCSSNIQSDVF